MSIADIHRLSIEQASALLAKKEISSVELTRAALERIHATDTSLHSFITITDEIALQQAHDADARRAHGEVGPLLGVPVGIKDMILTQGIRTTAGSKILGNFIAPYDATVTRKLLDAGAVCVGKVNCDEFAMGSSTENSAYQVTRNPWDLEPDTGGSIRQPAACCGVVGMKPTYGRVSRYGVIAYASSLDQVGPMARTVTGCAHMLGVIAGHDTYDSTSVNRPVPDYVSRLDGAVKGLRIGIPREYFVEGMDPQVEQAVRAAVHLFEQLGALVTPVSLPHTEYAIPAYYLIATAEASSNLARYDGIKYGLRVAESDGLLGMYQRTRAAGFGSEVKRRIMLGTYALSAGYYDAYYVKAQKVRTLIRRDFEEVFATHDVIATPTAPTTAFRIGEKTADPLQMYLSDIFTISINLAGLPGLSLPCGFDTAGLPIGLQIVGRPFEEERVFQAAYAYEQATEWHEREVQR
jgi:aspartyl-tRNA(Asn)/glutamyl-tRNA(Gln) amidotransferase subunit A